MRTDFQKQESAALLPLDFKGQLICKAASASEEALSKNSQHCEDIWGLSRRNSFTRHHFSENDKHLSGDEGEERSPHCLIFSGSDRRSSSRFKIPKISRHRVVHVVPVDELGAINTELKEWMRESYRLVSR